MISTSTAMALRPVLRPSWSRGIVACTKRNSSAFASATNPSTETSIPELEARDKFLDKIRRDSSLREQVAYSLSYASDSLKSDLESDNTFPLLDDRMKRQLRASYNALLSPSDNNAQQLRSQLPPHLDLGHLEATALGKSIKRKLPPLELEQESEETSSARNVELLPEFVNEIANSKLDKDSRAIVVTDTKNPFRIVTVNAAWEKLCGYSREECKGRSVGRLLQGPETDMSPVTAMIGKLLQGEQAGATLTNYTKHGRKFRNNITVGPISDVMGKTVYFVGILREVEDGGENLGSMEKESRKMKLPFMS